MACLFLFTTSASTSCEWAVGMDLLLHCPCYLINRGRGGGTCTELVLVLVLVLVIIVVSTRWMEPRLSKKNKNALRRSETMETLEKKQAVINEYKHKNRHHIAMILRFSATSLEYYFIM